MIKEKDGRFTCTDCGHVYSSMLGDDEIPETCNKCKKGVDFMDSNDYYINISAKGGHHVRLLFHRRSRGQQIQSC